MKRFEFEIKDFELKTFFPHFRIKEKKDILNILLEASRFMLIQNPLPKCNSDQKIVLIVDRMSRLFFFRKNKYYSINFPFNVIEDSSKLFFSYKDYLDIDAEAISNLISILKDVTFSSNSSFDFIEPIYTLEETYDENFWTVLKDLLFMEDGYIRYDLDDESYLKAKKDNKERYHPKHHYDIFYRNSATIKIGLYKNCLTEDFIDSISSSSECHYLNVYN